MTEPNQKLEALLFELVVQKPTAAERAAFLDDVCRDNPTLRTTLDELLAAHFGHAGFLPRLEDQPPESRGATRSGPSPLPPLAQAASVTLDRYRLLEKIGEGGFGEVWLAEQREPVKRRVAVKILKLGMDSKQVVARFEAERQALALMDHPNIAKILDAGTTPLQSVEVGRQTPSADAALPTPHSSLAAGRPYFVMELVRGIKITDYCDRHQLATRERLGLFIQVCAAIQHAHQKGIIHRDIKPSNILVTMSDGVPVPKVIDFGIAKALQQELTDKTLFTQFSQFVGTPAYISPEQAEAGGMDIDTRSDIYALGVLLYELLVGRTPFDPAEMVEGGLDALRRIIRQKEPVKPSTKLLALPAADRTAMAQRRQTEAVRLSHQLRGDLDWIVLKCLEKDRARRYETANALATDLQRHLGNEPIVARPPSAAYRIQKAWQRNKVLGTAAVVVTLALLAATGVSTWQAAQARRARNAEISQRLAAQTALRQEALERQRAEVSERSAQELLYAANLNLIGQAWDANDMGRVRQLLEETAGFPGRGFEWHYWQREAHLDLHTFRGHAARVWSADFSPDGQRIVTASEDGTGKVWDVATGQPLLTLAGHRDWVRSAAFSPDGTRIVTGSKDYLARIWDASTGAEIRQLRGHRGALRTVAFSPDGRRIVTASQDQTARIWDADTGQPLVTLRGHSNWVFSAAFSPDGRRVVTSGDDGTARIWDVAEGRAEGRELQRLKGHDGNVRTAVFSPDGRQVATAAEDRTVRIWDSDSGMPRAILTGHLRNVLSAAFSPDGRSVVTASGDLTVRIWDALSGREVNQFKGHGSEIYTAVFSRDGRRVLTASEDKTARVWDVASRHSALPLDYGRSVYAVAFSPDGQRMVAAGEDRGIQVWSTATGAPLMSLPAHESAVRSVAYSPDGRWIAAGQAGGSIRVWETAGGRLSYTLAGHAGGVSSVAFSPDSMRFVTAGEEGRIKVWKTSDGSELRSISPNQRQVYSAGFSPDGTRIVGVGVGLEAAKIWQADSGAEIMTLPNESTWARSISYSPDGRWILAACKDKVARVWDAASGRLRFALSGHSLAVYAAGFSPDGRRIVTASQDLSAKVWEAATGKELLTLHGHTADVTSAAFSPDGQRLVTGSLDGTARIWTTASSQQISTWRQEALSVPNRLSPSMVPLPTLTASGYIEPAFRAGLITRWLLLAPLEGPVDDATAALDLEQLPREAQLQPRAREQVRMNALMLTWEPVEHISSLLDYNFLVGKRFAPDSVAYAVSYLVCATRQTNVMFKIVSDDECKVYLNGQTIHRSDPNRSYVLDEMTVDGVELRAGVNTVVFKIWNHTDLWLGSLRVLDARGQEIPDLRVVLEPGTTLGGRDR